VSQSTAALHENHGAKTAPAEPEPPRKSRKRVILAVVAVVVLAAGAVVGMKLFASPPARQPDPATVPGTIEKIDSMTVNLADGRYLKVGVALQLSKKASPTAVVEGASTDGAVTFDPARAQDAVITVFGRRTYGQLLAAGGREKAQGALLKEVNKRYTGGVLGVYFTEFLMQ